jgi:2-oxoglutarate ferredoxin oxidoreductase subunit gamma
MERTEIVVGGFGGQGIILAGNIIGKAAAIYDNKHSTLTQDYGPEARGGACRAQVVISQDEVSYPYVEEPVVLVVMSQEAYTKYSQDLVKGALLLYDEDLVKPENPPTDRLYSIPATRFARDMGRSAVANIVMLGFFAALSDTIPADALKKSVLDSVPKGTEELNEKAFNRGYTYAEEQLNTAGKK